MSLLCFGMQIVTFSITLLYSGDDSLTFDSVAVAIASNSASTLFCSVNTAGKNDVTLGINVSFTA